MTREVQITFDCADPARQASFWAEALGYQLQSPPEGFDSWDAALETFGVPQDQWNSRSAILFAEASRLESLGANRSYRVEPDRATMEAGFITMQDPEGNEFCLD